MTPAWYMFYLEIVILEFDVPSRRATVQFPRGLPKEKIGVVGENREGFLCPYKVLSPMLQSFNDS